MTQASGSYAPRPNPVALARAVHARFAIQRPSEIEVELLAWHHGASISWCPPGGESFCADARVVVVGSRAKISLPAEARGTPRARFSIAHELGHLVMHPDFDAVRRIHGGARTERREFYVEYEADRFASELLVPHALAEATCLGVAEPTLAHVGEMARDFRVSLSVAGRRWPTMSGAACAFFEARGGIIRRAVRSEAFRGQAFERRALRDSSLAYEMLGAGSAAASYGRRVHERGWGSRAIGLAIVEECIPVADGVVVGWLTHA